MSDKLVDIEDHGTKTKHCSEQGQDEESMLAGAAADEISPGSVPRRKGIGDNIEQKFLGTYTVSDAELRLDRASPGETEPNKKRSSYSVIRDVIIVGKIGAGKSTLMDHIAKHAKAMEPTAKIHKSDHFTRVETKSHDLRLYEVDTPYSVSKRPKDALKAYYINKLKEMKQNGLQNEVNLIMLVFGHGHFTREEQEILGTLLSSLSSKAHEHCALIITRCEMLSTENRVTEKQIYASRRESRPIVEKAKMDTYCVGFPNLSNVREEFQEYYQKTIEQDQKEIWDLIEGCKAVISQEMLFGEDYRAIAVRGDHDQSHLSFFEKLSLKCSIL